MKNEYTIHCLGCKSKYQLIDYCGAKEYSQCRCGFLNSVTVPRDSNGDSTKEDISLVEPNKAK